MARDLYKDPGGHLYVPIKSAFVQVQVKVYGYTKHEVWKCMAKNKRITVWGDFIVMLCIDIYIVTKDSPHDVITRQRLPHDFYTYPITG